MNCCCLVSCGFCALVCTHICVGVTQKIWVYLFSLKEDLSDNEEMFPKEITKWSSNDLMDKIETPECDDVQGNLFKVKPACDILQYFQVIVTATF